MKTNFWAPFNCNGTHVPLHLKGYQKAVFITFCTFRQGCWIHCLSHCFWRNPGGHRLHLTERFIPLDRKKLLLQLSCRGAEFTVFPTVLRNSGGHRVHLTERFISLDRKKLLLQLFCLGARSPNQCKVAEHAGITWIPEANRRNRFLVTFHWTWNTSAVLSYAWPGHARFLCRE